MGTFILIVIVIIVIGSFLNGVTDRNKQVKDYNNLRDFERRQVANTLNIESNTIQKKENLYNEIVRKASDKQYAYDNSSQLVKLCKNYFHENGWHLTILEIIITALVTDKNFEEAKKYAKILCNDNLSYKWGLFFLGEIYEGGRHFVLSESHDMDKEHINSRKKELLPYIKAKTGHSLHLMYKRRNMEQLEIERRGEGRFILN